MTTTEMPWVSETRQPPRRGIAFGVVAAVGAAVGALLFLVAMSLVFLTPQLAGLVIAVLPVWGVLTLGTVGCAIAALVRRGRANVVLGGASLALVVLTNPLLPLIVALALGA